MVGPAFRAINSDRCRQKIAELFHYSRISRFEIDKKSVDLHNQEPDWIPAEESEWKGEAQTAGQALAALRERLPASPLMVGCSSMEAHR
jgi:hypothetical protein